MTGDKNDDGSIFNIHRIYIKDISFESPNAPQVFQEEWQPKIKLNLDITSHHLSKNTYEVILHVVVTAMLDDKVAFLCDLKQAGIFAISGIEVSRIEHCLGSYCPEILFPYVRECINSQCMRGSFPNFYLSPINFDALFTRYLEKKNIGGIKKTIISQDLL